MHTVRYLTVFLLAVAVGAGCSVIAGKEDPVEEYSRTRLRIDYRETLRYEESLRGASLREIDFSSPSSVALQRPVSVAADATRVYVVDLLPMPRLAIFDRGDLSLKFYTAPTPTSAANLTFQRPSGVAVDEKGFIYVADAQQGRVVVLDRKGVLQLVIGRTGELAFPSAIAIDTWRSRLYVADKQRHRVQAYTTRGDRLFEIGASGKQQDLKSPVGLALDRAGNCHVLDSQGRRVYVYDPDGRFLRVFPLTSNIPDIKVRPAGIAVDSVGHVYVTDSINNMVLVYGADGTFLQRWGRTGIQRDDFSMPSGIFIDGRDTIHIADQMNSRVQLYQYEK
jgi:DNA-binding beta-propeller fold protein YncE